MQFILKKRVLGLLISFIIYAALSSSYTEYLDYPQQINYTLYKINKNPSLYDNHEEIGFDDYIVELKEEPVINEIIEKRKVSEKNGGLKVNGEKVIYRDKISNLRDEHEKALKDFNARYSYRGGERGIIYSLVALFGKLTGITGKSIYDYGEIEASKEFYLSFNGMLLKNLSEESLEAINNSHYVKGIYKDERVYAQMYDSVGVTGADEVWKKDGDFNDCSVSGGACLTGEGVKIAILDTGINYYHPDFGGCFGEGCKVAGGYDFVNNDNDPLDDYGHGTHVAGIIAAYPGEFREYDLNISDLVAHWGLNDNLFLGNAVIDKTGVYNGTAIGGVIGGDEGLDNKSMKFDGLDDKIIVNDFNVSFKEGFTISLWVKINNNSGYIISKDKDFSLYYNKDISGFRFNIWNGTNYNDLFNTPYYKDPTTTIDRWQHVVITYNPEYYNESIFYKNGDVIGTSYHSHTDGDSLEFYIGGILSSGFFNGSIDDVMIFNRTLGVEEVMKIVSYQGAKFYSNSFKGKKVIGVAYNSTLYAYKVLNSYGSGPWSGILDAIEMSIDPNGDGDLSDRMDVISMSLGALCYPPSINCGPDDVVSRTVDNVVEYGVIAVVAAGNSGWAGIATPGTSRKAITVGASFKKDYIGEISKVTNPTINDVPRFSSRGPIKWTNANGTIDFLLKPDVIAPGVFICSTRVGITSDYSECDGGHVELSGTSMATPHVAGAVALIKQAHPDWGPEEIKNSLKYGAINLGENYTVNEQGYGRINITESITMEKPEILNVEITDMGGIFRIFVNYSKLIDIENTSIELSSGFNLKNWTNITLYKEEVNNNLIIKNLNTYNYTEGYYLMKVSVKEGERISEKIKVLYVDNLNIANLTSYDIYRNSGLLPIVLNIKGLNNESLKGYKIEYGLTKNKSFEYFSTKGLHICYQLSGKELVNYHISNSEICRDYYSPGNVVMLWNISEINETGLYALNLSVDVDSVNLSEVSNFNFIDLNMEKGWPKYIPYEEDSRWNGFLNPIVYDLDEDGKKEIIVNIGRNCWYQDCDNPYNRIRAYRHDGSILWENKINDYSKSYYYSTLFPQPAIGDVDGDGKKEIIVYASYIRDPYLAGGDEIIFGGKLYALDARTGAVKSEWPLDMAFDIFPELVVSDMNEDGIDDIVVQMNYVTWDENSQIVGCDMYIISNGSIITWKLHPSYSSGMILSPAIGDVDGDGKKEIVVMTNERIYTGGLPDPNQSIYVYNYTGGIISGWPKSFKNSVSFYENLILADMNEDGIDDIIVPHMIRYYDNYTITVFDGNGSEIKTYFPELRERILKLSANDIDYDGKTEIAFMTSDVANDYNVEKIYLAYNNGSIINGWPNKMLKMYAFLGYYYTRDNPVFADVDGDKNVDLILNEGAGLPLFKDNFYYYDNMSSEGYGLFAWHTNGSYVNGFPRTTQFSSDVSPVVGDLDSDGKIEIISISHYDTNPYSHYNLLDYSLKKRSSIYVWSLNGSLPLYSSFDPERLNNQWLGYKKDTGHTGCFSCDVDYFPKYEVNESDGVYSNFIIEMPDVAVIRYSNPINLSRYGKNYSIIKNVDILKGHIKVNSNIIPEFNDSAEILFKNIDFGIPKVLYDGKDCPPDICLQSVFFSANKTLFLNVSSIHRIDVVDAGYCGDDICSWNEACSSCSLDCGVCSYDSGGGGSGGFGGGGSGDVFSNESEAMQEANYSIENESIIHNNGSDYKNLSFDSPKSGDFFGLNYYNLLLIAIIFLIIILVIILIYFLKIIRRE